MCSASLFNKKFRYYFFKTGYVNEESDSSSLTDKVAAAPESQMILLEQQKVLLQALWLCLRNNHIHHSKHSHFHTF